MPLSTNDVATPKPTSKMLIIKDAKSQMLAGTTTQAVKMHCLQGQNSPAQMPKSSPDADAGPKYPLIECYMQTQLQQLLQHTPSCNVVTGAGGKALGSCNGSVAILCRKAVPAKCPVCSDGAKTASSRENVHRYYQQQLVQQPELARPAQHSTPGCHTSWRGATAAAWATSKDNESEIVVRAARLTETPISWPCVLLQT
jgi:hypothetical protein